MKTNQPTEEQLKKFEAAFISANSFNGFIRPVLRDETFTAYRALDFATRTFIPVTIKRSISILYEVTTGNREDYTPITYKNRVKLDAIHELFTGSPTVEVMKELQNVRVRSGWMDKSLSNLEFIPIIDLYTRFVNDRLERKEQQKLRQVLSAITMSKRDMVKCYELPAFSKYASWSVPIVHLDENFKEVSNIHTNKFTITATRLETQNAKPI